jgi:hypothetical protein
VRGGRKSSENQHRIIATVVQLTPGLVRDRWTNKAAAAVHREFAVERNLLAGFTHNSNF